MARSKGPTMPNQLPNKAIAAGGTTALAGAITTLIVAIWWPSATPEIVGALTTVVATILTLLATYAMPVEKTMRPPK